MSYSGISTEDAVGHYQKMLAASDIGFIILSPEWKIEHANDQARRILHYDTRDIKANFLDCIDLPNRDKAKRMLDALLDTGMISDWEMNLYNGDISNHIYFTGMWTGANAIFMLKPLEDSVHKLQEVVIRVNNDLTNLNRELERKQVQLQRANSKIQEMHQVLSEKNALMQQDLRMAKIVQRALLDKMLQPHHHVHIEKEYHPADSVGGDLYDVAIINDYLTGILICDVSGHGVASALVMAVIKNIFRNCAQRYTHPHELLQKMNREFLEIFTTQAFDHYATAFYIIVDTQNKMLRYCGAGHPYPCLYSQTETEELIAPGYPIGLFNQVNYKTQAKPYREKDRLLLYTDGFQDYLEAIEGNQVDLTHYDWGTIKTVFKKTASSLDAQSVEQGDDVCMMIVEFEA